MKNRVLELLEKGKPIINKEPGNSMTPILTSKEPVILDPGEVENIKKGDIVFAKIRGHFYTHLVHGVDPEKGVLLGNNHGHIQGWTKKVYAKAHRIPKEWQTTNEKQKEYLNDYILHSKA